MAHLLIGSVSATTASVWVRGDRRSGEARLRYRAVGTGAWSQATVRLEVHRGYCAVANLAGLAPGTAYECELSFSKAPPPPVRTGAFRTAPAGDADVAFIVGSCNFSKLALFNSKNVDAAWTGIGALAAAVGADFMIHCGDQIYSDLPGVTDPDLGYFQREYQGAWKRRPTARVLASLPHYMMLDDHEIFDAFSNDTPYLWKPSPPIRDFALEAYRQYQHAHNPQTYPGPALYYAFEFGGVRFFALDVRSERWKRHDPQMISVLQMAEFKAWLLAHAGAPKFVVTSIPFVAEARDKDDKWCGDPFKPQRDEIVDFLAARGIGRLCFLTGDMHCSYHAEMRITAPGGAAITVHELMASPINQVATGMHQFVDRPARSTPGGATYQTLPLDPARFYGSHSNVMVVRYRRAAAHVVWEVHRTKGAPTPPVPVLSGAFPL
ncbi:MAG TPA: alkaline phosphatase D family protein [Vicinamibacteria bacterium]|jgi:phosphodiesterase/alkaline phosphatase D-like protein